MLLRKPTDYEQTYVVMLYAHAFAGTAKGQSAFQMYRTNKKVKEFPTFEQKMTPIYPHSDIALRTL